MSEVKRFDLCGYGGGLIEHPDGALYHMDDFDRVTVERDAALGREAKLHGDVAASKQLLEATRDALEAAQYLNKEVTGRVSECEKLFSDLVNSSHAVAVPIHLWKRVKEFASVGQCDAALAQESTLERDAANWKRKACESADREHDLQQRLTAADERADVLDGLLNLAQGHIGDASLSRDIDAALKPAEGRGDEHRS